LGTITFPVVTQYVDDIVLVKDDEIKEAMKIIWERLKIVIEPSSAITLAALKKYPVRNKKIGLILSGGNVKFPFSF
jgi:threonine dehydratase